jgi:hypothetical protein
MCAGQCFVEKKTFFLMSLSRFFQTFYPMPQIEEVRNGDYVAARCTYNTTMKDTHTQIGNNSFRSRITAQTERPRAQCSDQESSAEKVPFPFKIAIFLPKQLQFLSK